MRVACVLINNLPVQITLAANPEWCGKPLVIGGQRFEAKPVVDASPEAAACGVQPGMLLRQADALCPEAIFSPPDEQEYEQAFEKVIGILEDFSPIVDEEALGCVYLDFNGVRSEGTLSSDMASRISALTGLTASVGIGSSKFLCRAAALTSTRQVPVIVPAGDESNFLAPFSIDLLPCADKTKERLRRLGIRFIGQIGQLSLQALVAQFGTDGIRLYDLARGIDGSPLVSRKKPELISDTATMDPWAISWPEILQHCQTMLERMLDTMRVQGKVCREIMIRIGFISGAFQERKLPLKEATCSDAAILGRLRTWLETIRFPGPVIEVGLSLYTVRETGRELRLWPDHKRKEQPLNRLLKELKSRFGYQPIKKLRVADADAILPERRFRLTDALE